MWVLLLRPQNILSLSHQVLSHSLSSLDIAVSWDWVFPFDVSVIYESVSASHAHNIIL